MECGSHFSGGITFSCTAEKSDPLLLFSNNGSYFFRDHFFSLHRGGIPGRLRIFENLQKSCKNAFFKKDFQNPALNFCAFGRKTLFVLKCFDKILKVFDENSIEKLIFLLYFSERFLLKIEPLELTSFFSNIFSGSGGGLNPSIPPAYSTAKNSPVNHVFRVSLPFFGI